MELMYNLQAFEKKSSNVQHILKKSGSEHEKGNLQLSGKLQKMEWMSAAEGHMASVLDSMLTLG